MNSVVLATSAEAVSALLDLVDAPSPIVDTTYGNGTFWKGSTRTIIGSDCDSRRAPSLIADFRHLPFADSSIATVIFDPPFHPAVNSAEEQRFKAMGSNERQMKQQFVEGITECWRVTRSYLIVKCQGFVHNHRPQVDAVMGYFSVRRTV